RGTLGLVQAMHAGEVSLSTAALVADSTPEEQQEVLKRIAEGRWMARGVRKLLKQVQRTQVRERALASPLKTPAAGDAIQLHHCRLQDLVEAAKIEPASVGLVLTDIPYGKEFLPEVAELAALAARILRPGGVFVTYSGQLYLNQVMRALDEHLTYRWTR